MELKWLEDLLMLLEEQSVTRAAARRHVTQPAFSRRIRQLEEWLGMEIVDRSTKPIRILPTGWLLEDGVRDLVNRHYALRNSVHGNPDKFTFVSQHMLAILLFPELIRRVKALLPETSYRVITADNNQCESLFLKEAEFLLCYQSEQERFDFSQLPVYSVKLGTDCLVPVASRELADKLGGLPPGSNLPLLMYQQGGFMARVLANNCLVNVMRDYRVEQICESAFSASLRGMVLAGMGIAWLVTGMIERELGEGELVSYESTLGSADLDIMLFYRDSEQAVRIGKLIADFETVAG